MAKRRMGNGKSVLTPQQRQVLSRVDQGLKHQEIADELGLSLSTIRTHIRNCVNRLDAKGGHSAAYEARRRGLIDPPDTL